MHVQQDQANGLGSAVLPKAIISTLPAPAALPVPGSLTWKPASMSASGRQAASPASVRCTEKGCVFPGSPGPEGKCLHHLRQTQEPVLFSSYQPTRAVLDRGRFEIPDEEVDTSRTHDRRKLAAIREAFLED
ncbi:MAG TPA: hypothetical protein VGY31_11310 [Terriglobia bacterium]|nr:hypothetical protein [Terriglobia bacterium]